MHFINLNDYEKKAKEKLSKHIFDHIAGGANDEFTLSANKSAYERLQLRPRVMVDVSKINYATSVLGKKINIPILIAPSSAHKMVYGQGEIATAKAAKQHNIIMIVSTTASSTIEEVAQTKCNLWLQLYIYKNHKKIAINFIKRAEKAGYKAIVLTVDSAAQGRRERDIKNKFKLPKYVKLANFTHESWKGNIGFEKEQITWETIKWLQSITSLPIILKGILTHEDALLAVKYGVSGIIVSNHGGRQLDFTPPTIEILPEIVAAVNKKCEIYIDGGIRRGTEIIKALSLGAKAVLIGRPILYGLAVNGFDGVSDVLQILVDELETTMKLIGCTDIQKLNQSYVRLSGFSKNY